MKILIAIPTYSGDRYALVPLLQHIQQQTYQDFDIFFLDNSKADYVSVLQTALKAAFPTKNCIVLHLDAGTEKKDIVMRSRNAIRDYFLQHDYTHLFFIDDDVLIPPHALATLIAAQQPLVTGLYVSLFAFEGKKTVLPVAYKSIGEGRVRNYHLPEVFANRTLPVAVAGLGCTLIERALLEQFSFRRIRDSTEDTPFYIDARSAGVQPLLLCSIRCTHLQHPIGDKRNQKYDIAFLEHEFKKQVKK